MMKTMPLTVVTGVISLWLISTFMVDTAQAMCCGSQCEKRECRMNRNNCLSDPKCSWIGHNNNCYPAAQPDPGQCESPIYPVIYCCGEPQGNGPCECTRDLTCMFDPRCEWDANTKTCHLQNKEYFDREWEVHLRSKYQWPDVFQSYMERCGLDGYLTPAPTTPAPTTTAAPTPDDDVHLDQVIHSAKPQVDVCPDNVQVTEIPAPYKDVAYIHPDSNSACWMGSGSTDHDVVAIGVYDIGHGSYPGSRLYADPDVFSLSYNIQSDVQQIISDPCHDEILALTAKGELYAIDQNVGCQPGASDHAPTLIADNLPAAGSMNYVWGTDGPKIGIISDTNSTERPTLSLIPINDCNGQKGIETKQIVHTQLCGNDAITSWTYLGRGSGQSAQTHFARVLCGDKIVALKWTDSSKYANLFGGISIDGNLKYEIETVSNYDATKNYRLDALHDDGSMCMLTKSELGMRKCYDECPDSYTVSAVNQTDDKQLIAKIETERGDRLTCKCLYDDDRAIPVGWVKMITSDGTVYYQNESTGEIQMDLSYIQ